MTRISSGAARAIKRVGRQVDVTVFEKVGEDDYGENWDPTDDSPLTAFARVDRSGGAAQGTRDARSASTDTDAAIFLHPVAANGHAFVYGDTTWGGSDYGGNFSGTTIEIRDGGGDGATEVDVDGMTYIVIEADDQDNGIIRLACRRET